MLKFNSAISTADFANKETENLFERKITNKLISINSKDKNFKPTNLIISEGKNTHLFILEFKENLDDSEYLYDFSDKKRLADEARKLDESGQKQTAASINDKPVNQSNEKDNVNQNNSVEINNSNTAIPDNSAKPPSPIVNEQNTDKFTEFVDKANKEYINGNFDNARTLYKDALTIKATDIWSKSQIERINQIETSAKAEGEKKIRDIAYNNHIRIADSAFKRKAYETAASEYKLALVEKQNDAYARSRLLAIDAQKNEETFNSYMSIGRDAFANNLFDNAELAFNEALKYKPNNTEAKKELAKIKPAKLELAKKLKDREKNIEKEKAYNDTVYLADNMFETGLYLNAKKLYIKADKMNPGEIHPKKRMMEIDSILSLKQAAVNERKRDSLNMLKYDAEVEKGDKAMQLNDLNKALTAYKLAESLRPSEQYPGSKISQIKIMLKQIEDDKKAETALKALQDSINRQYNFLISQGTIALNKNDYLLAKDFFSHAHLLKSDESSPLLKLDIINKKLDEIINQEKYEAIIDIADSLTFQAKEYELALNWYDSAHVIKPLEKLPQSQIIYIRKVLLTRDSLLMVQQKEEVRTRTFNSGIGIYKRADTARKDPTRYGEAYEGFSAFLSKIDTFSLSDYSQKQLYYINNALDYVKRLKPYQKKKETAISTNDTLSSDTGNKKKKNKKNKTEPQKNTGLNEPKTSAIIPFKDSSASAFYYPLQRDINKDELNRKYPDIEFTQPPPAQIFSYTMLDYSKQIQYINKEILLEKTRINLMDILNRVHLKCQLISFKEDYIYFRFLIENTDTTDFLTGPMIMNIAKKNENLKKLAPIFISDFPIVLPGKERVIVYVIKPIILQNDESLVFEMSDRLNKVKLKVNISSTIFDIERAR